MLSAEKQTLPMIATGKINGQVKVTLKGGAGALLRPVTPEDKWRLASGLVQMSPQSRYFRFFTPTASLTEGQLRYFTEVDLPVARDLSLMSDIPETKEFRHMLRDLEAKLTG